MKKILVIMILFVLLLTGCGKITESQKSTQESDMFVCIREADYNHCYDIAYHKDTKVMYVISHGPYSYGNFTVLVNQDGSPMLYKGE